MRLSPAFRTRRTDAEITVSLLPVMAGRWLVPRLSRFTARFPHIKLHIKTGQSLANFKSDGVDIAIRFGTGELGRLSFTQSDILAGKLVRLSEHSLRVAYSHYAVHPIASEFNPALVTSRDWLVEEATRS